MHGLLSAGFACTVLGVYMVTEFDRICSSLLPSCRTHMCAFGNICSMCSSSLDAMKKWHGFLAYLVVMQG